jgi:hypothetical protein
MTDMPIACSLSPDRLPARLAFIEALAADGLLERTATAAGVRIRLRDLPDIERRTRELIAAEADCCAFLTFTLRRDQGALVLDVAGPPEARPVIDLFLTGAG